MKPRTSDLLSGCVLHNSSDDITTLPSHMEASPRITQTGLATSLAPAIYFDDSGNGLAPTWWP
ncbi:hypothetical protein QQ020_33415 [Fulvivirgaceae bacterium BMA12]|uniref:Uncharacterized protein n=1 Tax=Agaribacillus aureus TaxID=3051825 RepID=A0ABT8LGT9_9BACT|nr:hypothetical protein [Fulvivirgaceae bacterium BMA12]